MFSLLNPLNTTGMNYHPVPGGIRRCMIGLLVSKTGSDNSLTVDVEPSTDTAAKHSKDLFGRLGVRRWSNIRGSKSSSSYTLDGTTSLQWEEVILY